MRAGEMFGALKERQFRLLWLGQATSTLGDGLVPVAVAFAVIKTLDRGPTALGIVLAAQAVPVVVFVLAGGVWADRLPRQMVMLASDVVRALCAGKSFLFADRGENVLRGFEDPVHVYEVRWREEAGGRYRGHS